MPLRDPEENVILFIILQLNDDGAVIIIYIRLLSRTYAADDSHDILKNMTNSAGCVRKFISS